MMEGPATLEFDATFKKKILSGDKTCTIRFDDADGISDGDKVMLKVDHGELFGSAEVTRKVVKSVGEIVGMNIDGHREYETTEEFMNEMRRYYGGKISTNSDFYMIWFELEGFEGVTP